MGVHQDLQSFLITDRYGTSVKRIIQQQGLSSKKEESTKTIPDPTDSKVSNLTGYRFTTLFLAPGPLVHSCEVLLKSQICPQMVFSNISHFDKAYF
jgi:hypothetical protein